MPETVKRKHSLYQQYGNMPFASKFGRNRVVNPISAAHAHASLPESLYQKTDLTDNLIRLSVGAEHSDDLSMI